MRKVSFSGFIKFFKILGHASLWLLFFGFPALMYYQTTKVKEFGNPFVSPYYWLFGFSFVLFFYVNTYILIPKFFLKKKYLLYAGILLLLFILFNFLRPTESFFAHVLLPLQGLKSRSQNYLTLDFTTFVLLLMIVACGLSIQIIKQWQLSVRRALQAEADKANAELSFLKTQINPHFLFNALNTIYSLILTQNAIAGDAVLKLSNIMRYVTDDATSDFVSLKKEVASITDYIDLQRLQHGIKVEINYSIAGNLENRQIAPLVLLTYIENAFKYGISNHEAAPITIMLTTEDNKISFFCQNKIFSKPGITERSGIGLLNTQKRLEYLYPGKHELAITSRNNLYTVALTLLV